LAIESSDSVRAEVIDCCAHAKGKREWKKKKKEEEGKYMTAA
jgi:hypothetical protein